MLFMYYFFPGIRVISRLKPRKVSSHYFFKEKIRVGESYETKVLKHDENPKRGVALIQKHPVYFLYENYYLFFLSDKTKYFSD